jgi:DNA-binding NarL/FixJ family response regulator
MVSRPTVSKQVSQVLAKLGARNRVEVANAVASRSPAQPAVSSSS